MSVVMKVKHNHMELVIVRSCQILSTCSWSHLHCMVSSELGRPDMEIVVVRRSRLIIKESLLIGQLVESIWDVQRRGVNRSMLFGIDGSLVQSPLGSCFFEICWWLGCSEVACRSVNVVVKVPICACFYKVEPDISSCYKISDFVCVVS